jgi:hypothetical protein
MPRYLVKQPNGLYAEFSTIVDAFTIFNMDEQEAIDYYKEAMSPADAANKVKRGVEDQPVQGGPAGSGVDRWNECLRIMELVNPVELRRIIRNPGPSPRNFPSPKKNSKIPIFPIDYTTLSGVR